MMREEHVASQDQEAHLIPPSTAVRRGSQQSIPSDDARSPSPKPPAFSRKGSARRKSASRSRKSSAHHDSPESSQGGSRRQSFEIDVSPAGPLRIGGSSDDEDDSEISILNSRMPFVEENHGRTASVFSAASDSRHCSPINRSISKESVEEALCLVTTNFLADYDLEKSLGEGAFANVRLATHRLTKMKVAVKILDKRKIKEDYVIRNLHREGNLLKDLRHPHVIELYEIVETDDFYCLVTELASGGEILDYIVAHGALTEKEARKFTRQMIAAIDYLHHGNVVHRDLKAENLLLDFKFDLKIVDFGLSNSIAGKSFLKTQCGSPAYTAPELLGGKKYDERVDIWSIGINLYAMLTGKLPFASDNITLLHAMILDQNYHVPSHFSNELVDLLSKILVAKPQNRITIEELRKHPWVIKDANGPIVEADCPYPIREYEIDAEVIEYLVTAFSYDGEEIIESVTTSSYNHLAALYHLSLAEKKQYGTVGHLRGISSKKKRQGLRRANTDLNLRALHEAHLAISRENSARVSHGVVPSPIASARRGSASRAQRAEKEKPLRQLVVDAVETLKSRKEPLVAGPVRVSDVDGQSQEELRPLTVRRTSSRVRRNSTSNDEYAMLAEPLPSLNAPSSIGTTGRRGSSSLTRTRLPTPATPSREPTISTSATVKNRESKSARIRTIRYPMNKQMVSSKGPDVMLQQLITAVKSMDFKVSKSPESHYCLRLRLNDVIIESEVVQLPGLKVHGIHFHRVKGDPFEIRELCSSILDAVDF